MRKVVRLGTFAVAAFALLAVAVAQDSEEEKKAPNVGTKVGQTIPRFEVTLLDLSKEKAQEVKHDSRKLDKPVTYVFLRRTCPWCKSYKDRLTALSKLYRPKGMEFVFVYPVRDDSPDAKKTYHRDSRFAGLFLDDIGAKVTKALGIQRTPEVVVVSRKGAIVFRGGIDDSPWKPEAAKKTYLRNAIEQHLAGEPVTVPTSSAYG